VQSLYGAPSGDTQSYIICAAAGLLALCTVFLILNKKVKTALLSGAISALILSIGSYALILPGLEQFRTSERLAVALRAVAPNTAISKVHSPDFTEPSLVYHLGKDIDLNGNHPVSLQNSKIIVLDTKQDSFQTTVEKLEVDATLRGQILEVSDPIKGFNYSEGDVVELVILTEVPKLLNDQTTPDAKTNRAPDP